MTLDIFCKSREQFWRPQLNSFPKKCAYFCRKVFDGNLAKFLSIWETTCLHFSPVRPNRCSYEAEIICGTCNDLSSFTGCNFFCVVFCGFFRRWFQVLEIGKKRHFWKSSKFPHFSSTFEKIKSTLEYLILSLFNIFTPRNPKKTGNVKILQNKKTYVKPSYSCLKSSLLFMY